MKLISVNRVIAEIKEVQDRFDGRDEFSMGALTALGALIVRLERLGEESEKDAMP